MRLLLMACLLALIPSKAFTQNDSAAERKHEIGINLFSAKALSFEYKNRAPIPGIYYRRHWKANALRVSAEFRKRTYYAPGNIYDSIFGHYFYDDSLHVTRTYFDGRIGYQRTFFHWPRLVPYVFAELAGSVRFNKGTWTDRRGNESLQLDNRIVEGGLSIGAGISWRFWKQLTVCYETDLQVTSGTWYSFMRHTHYPWIDAVFRQVRTFGLSWKF